VRAQSIFRYCYAPVATVLVEAIDPLLLRYGQGLAFLQSSGRGGGEAAEAESLVRMTECQLAWLVTVIGAVVGGSGNTGPGYPISYTAYLLNGATLGAAGPGITSSSMLGGAGVGSAMNNLGGISGGGGGGGAGGGPTEEQLDAELSRRVFNLMDMLDSRITAGLGTALPGDFVASPALADLKADARLEIAFIGFLSSFRKAYINEQGGLPTLPLHAGASTALLLPDLAPAPTTSSGSSAVDAAMGGGGTKADMTLAAAYASRRAAATAGLSGEKAAAAAAQAALSGPATLLELFESASGRQKVFYGMLLHMQLGDHTAVVSSMIAKLASNLRWWGDHSAIVEGSLEVLNDLIFSYTSGRLLLSLPVIETMLANHTEEWFPFLRIPANARCRTSFYSALGRLVFMEDESEVRRRTRARTHTHTDVARGLEAGVGDSAVCLMCHRPRAEVRALHRAPVRQPGAHPDRPVARECGRRGAACAGGVSTGFQGRLCGGAQPPHLRRRV